MSEKQPELFKVLNDRQRKFAEAYLNNGYNKKQAAISAGYSKNGAEVTGHQVLSSTNVKKYVDSILNDIIESELTTLKKKVLEEFNAIGFSDIKDILNDQGNIDLSKISEVNTRAIKAIHNDIVKNKQGEEVTRVKVVYHDKIKTLELISKYLGILTEKHEINGSLHIDVKFE